LRIVQRPSAGFNLNSGRKQRAEEAQASQETAMNPMHPYFAEQIAASRVTEMINDAKHARMAAESRRARRAERRARRAARKAAAAQVTPATSPSTAVTVAPQTS
jgi:hypothetical protein